MKLPRTKKKTRGKPEIGHAPRSIATLGRRARMRSCRAERAEVTGPPRPLLRPRRALSSRHSFMPSLFSLWSRALAAFGIYTSTGDVAFEEDRVILRDLHRAKAFPQEPREPGRREIAACERCDRPLRQVVFTTAGRGAQAEIWREYPLAIDGWMCRGCGWSAMPRFLSAEESGQYGREAAAHASNGQFDDAEFWLRRIIGSWPGCAPGYAELGQLSSARAEAATDPEAKERHRSEAEAWFRRAVLADPDRKLAGVRVPLARTLALNGKERDAFEVLDGLLCDAALPASVRTEAETLATDLRDGKALFSRAAEMSRCLALEPPSKPLTTADRDALERARALLRQAAERKGTFPTLWFLGKVEMRLGDMDAALAAFQRAHAIDPEQPDGCRELGAVYLELDRAHDALPVARRAIELRPDDAGLHCNLALILLLTGDVEGALAKATSALSLDPTDAITRGLLKLIDDVVTGRRQRPRSLAEAEGRKR
ncbi:tetratricopeptide repeat protein [Sorangium sp. So ce117]|uniref:tetratricopeptide repeat protein n=1 Tax=Sorangium sp. So ce117 TaxID=3133277 RepID=UPI003F61A73B